MANNRFTSVNLNKSYGQSLHSGQSNTNTNYGLGRGGGGGGGGRGGGMVVLSRPRSAHKVGPKLSVPPPLNLPSLRKEHQRFDSLGNGPAAGGGGLAGSGARPSSSGMGWSKPGALVEGSRAGASDPPLSSEGVDHGFDANRGKGGLSTGSGVYKPPSAVSTSADGLVSAPSAAVQKATVFRGEDFPSLRATLNAASANSSSNGPTQKHHKELGHQKHSHSQGMTEEPSGGPGRKEGFDLSSRVDMRPQGQSSQHSFGVQGREDNQSSTNFRPVEQGRKLDDFFSGPLPLVRLSPRSDWADDERDTSHGLTERSRDHSYSRTQNYWDRDFDLPRSSLPPVKPAHSLIDRRGQQDNDVGKSSLNEVSNVDPFGRDVRVPSREGRDGHSWRNLGNARDEYNVGATASRDYMSGQRDHGRQQWNKSSDLNNGRGLDRSIRDLHGNDTNKYKADVAQNSPGLRSSFSPGNKGISGSDRMTNFGRDKRSSLRSEKPYVEDPFSAFDAPDPFPGSILGVVKRKKDVNKQLDFHDPVRESFEAELERVQKIQEQERQRVIEEQERAMEMARREEEEIQRVAREQEERQRQLEEEARDAAWRAEQERLEGIRRAEELRIAREEEKQRILMEEERRKQAAKQKLIELEEKMARRQTEASKASSSAAVPSDILPGAAKERDAPRADDFSCWEDGERMVERITNSASSDSSLSRPFDLRSNAVPGRDGSFAFPERSKPFSSRRRDMFENGSNSSFFSAEYENGHHSPRRDVSFGGRSFPRKDIYNGQGYMPTRGYYRGGMPEPHMEDFPYTRSHRWNMSGDGDHYGRNMELEADFSDNMGDRFNLDWGQGRGRGNSFFPERYYQNPESDELYTYGRPRYPVRQPRVLPPPLPSVQRTSFRGVSAKEGEQSAKTEEQGLDRSSSPGHDSQSSLSVSSPPSSPTHLSHDDLDETRESLGASPRAEGQDISLSENEAHLVNDTVLKGTASSISVADDEEWAIENNGELQLQEEYDEDVGYNEEDEVHERDDEDAELNREFEDLHLEENDSPCTDNLVLGFDQGVEVGMPNEDYEKSPGVDESLFAGTQEAVSVEEQKESLDSGRDGLSSQTADDSQLVSSEESRVMVQETEKTVESTNVSLPLDPSNTSGSASGAVKLQFGLFSGPSLIPSPVPAIQIGSIQMPLQLHPQISPSLTHMHSPQPPLFQFGQLRYPSPISQGILPLAPQSMSFVQPNVQYCSSQVLGGPPSVQPVQNSSQSSVKDDVSSHSMNSSHVQLPHQLKVHQNTESREASLLATPGAGNSLSCQNHDGATDMDQIRMDLGQQAASLSHSSNAMRNTKPLLNNRVSESRGGLSASHSIAYVKDSGGSSQGQFVGNRGRKFAFTARNSGARASSSANEASRSDVSGFQRKPRRGPQRFEFRVRQPADGKQSSVTPSSGIFVPDTKSNSDGKGNKTWLKSGFKKALMSDKSRQTADAEISGSDPMGSGIVNDKTSGKEAAVTSGLDTSHRSEGSLKRNISSEDDVDAPLQSGIVRVFKQPGIEAPSDEDDFIEVRSKRQMLNDRREQREKEIKAKSRNMKKGQRKSRPFVQSSVIGNLSRTAAPSSGPVTKSLRSAVTKRGLLNNEVSATLNNVISQPLAPIGTPPVGSECQTDGKSQTTKLPQTSTYVSSGLAVGHEAPDLTFDAQRKVNDGVQSLGSWSTPNINQPVMALTQTQLEEAMKPAHFDAQVKSIVDCGTSVNDSGMPSLSGVAKDSPFSSAASPISSLLAGEKIQFGAVTSPTILPPSTRGSSFNIMPPASLPLDIQISQSMPVSQSNCDIFFGKEKHPDESCPPLEDRQAEAEAEAAASAVAVAAIGNDEVAGSRIGNCSTSTSESKGFSGAVVNGIKIGMSSDQHVVASQSKAEETLSVSLPADLSVETPPMSIWPPLPSPNSSSSQMISPFPGGPTHFPFYDVNPMMGGPVFSFGPQEESAGQQPQQRKSGVSSSGLLGAWQQCHTGIDSFYGPPAGFTAPYINPPGSIPGVQGPSHMVVYNHFAPVGQFGQVGLSYMGTTYIPSGKQPDWKHNPASSLGGDGEMNSTDVVQRSAPNVPTPAQHLAPGSPLLPMPSPLAMWEVSPFQSSHDNSMHSRWSHVQPSSIHGIPQSMPLQQQAEGIVPPQSSQGSVDNHSLAANGFSKPQTSSLLEDGRSFTVVTNAPVTQFPGELGLVNPPVSSGPESLSLNASGPVESTKVHAAPTPAPAEGSGSNRAPRSAVSALNKPQSSKQRNPSGQQQYTHYQRGRGQKNGSGAEWSNRKPGFHGRNHSPGGERGFAPAKVKQIYVAKQRKLRIYSKGSSRWLQLEASSTSSGFYKGSTSMMKE